MRRLGFLGVWWATAALAAPYFVNLTPSTSPSDRRSSGAAVRRVSPETYVGFGGFVSGTGSVSELLTYRPSTNTWTVALPAALPARERHGFAYDPVHDFFALAGGANGVTVTDTVFVISGDTLGLTAPAAPATRPSARVDPLLQWVPALGKFLYFGGRTSVFANNHVADSWTLDVADGGVTWAALSGTGPTPRGATCSGVDPVSGKVFMFGGEGTSNLADTWAFSPDGGGWSPVAVSGAVPSARSFSACAWDEKLKQLVLYGGTTSAPVGGLFTFDPATNVWTSWTPTQTPGPLSDTVAAYSPTLGGVVFFAGQNATAAYTHETWLLTWNQPPGVDAGPDFTVDENATATLQGFVVDPDGDLTTVSWVQTGGPAVTLALPTGLNPTFVAPTVFAATPLTFRFTASDATSSTSDDVVVTVLNTIDEPPVADAGPDQIVNAGATVTLSGSGVDPNSDSITYAWTQLVGPVVSLSSASVANPTFTAPSPLMDTELGFSLQVTARGATSGPDQVLVLVRADRDAGVIAIDAGLVDAGMADAGAVDAGESDAGPPDAGAVDAGESDAGAADAGDLDAGDVDAGGVDAGRADAGAVDADAGPEDGGPREGARYAIGCGCTAVPPAAAWWLAALLMLVARRRRP